ncbi:nicotinate-nucleotide--dimethylbenzimidazole phosphoribosyltransferase [Halorutilales archaeon Cl-col2-1]
MSDANSDSSFETHTETEIEVDIPPLDDDAGEEARQRQSRLTKPEGSLGDLEDLSVRIAGMKANPTPRLDQKAVVTMAGDHGVVEEGVSAYPPEVTAQMVYNFLEDGAAVNSLADVADARNVVVDMGVAEEIESPDLVDKKVDYGTSNIAEEPAMTRSEAVEAVEAGRGVVREHVPDADVIGLGDMGIGNTTPSSAVTAYVADATAEEVVGRGTGVDDDSLRKKTDVVETAVERADPEDAIDVLAELGGYEMGGLAGVALEAASRRVPVVVDGFITGAACLVAAEIEPDVTDYLLGSHSSVESGHEVQFDCLGVDPLFDLDLRLGEGTGACLAFNVFESACTTLRQMATFDNAGVSDS